MNTKGIYEVLQEVNKVKTKEGKIEALRKNDTAVLRSVLMCAYHPAIKWLLPEGAPPYKPSEALDSQGVLFSKARQLYLFLNAKESEHLTPLKRETLFIQFIESLDKDDAKMMCIVKDKKLPFKSITKEIVAEAFPGILG